MNEPKKQSDSSQKDPMTELYGNVVFSYSRAQAIEDGVLVDVSEMAREAGFKWPFALTAEVWALIDNIPDTYSHEDMQGRLWDVLTMARHAVSKAGKGDDLVFFDVILRQSDRDKVRLKLHVGPADDFNPVLTLMLPEQD